MRIIPPAGSEDASTARRIVFGPAEMGAPLDEPPSAAEPPAGPPPPGAQLARRTPLSTTNQTMCARAFVIPPPAVDNLVILDGRPCAHEASVTALHFNGSVGLRGQADLTVGPEHTAAHESGGVLP